MDVTIYLPSQQAAEDLTQDLPAGVKVDTSTLAPTAFQGLTWLVVLAVPDDLFTRTLGPSNQFSQVLRDVHRLQGAVRTPDPA